MLTAHSESLAPELSEPVLDMSILAITAEATQAHSLVIATGLRHVEGKDSCVDQGISRGQVEQCPYYREADIAYTSLVRRGQKGSAH